MVGEVWGALGEGAKVRRQGNLGGREKGQEVLGQ